MQDLTVRDRSNAGQTMVKRWSNAGQTLVERNGRGPNDFPDGEGNVSVREIYEGGGVDVCLQNWVSVLPPCPLL